MPDESLDLSHSRFRKFRSHPLIYRARAFRTWTRSLRHRKRVKRSLLGPNENVLFFPSYAKYNSVLGQWESQLHGWVFRPSIDSRFRRMMIRIFSRVLGITPEQAETPIFQRRAFAFLVKNVRHKRLSVRVANQVTILEKSKGSGHVHGHCVFAPEAIEQEPLAGNSTVLTYEILTTLPGSPQPQGEIHCIPEQGISVISDIDDTIKHSEVANRRVLLANTFLRPFRSVPGMSEVYQRWEQQGAVFHYVSSSPWQLFEPLHEFLQEEGFPQGTFHLKLFRWKNSGLLKLFSSPKALKFKTIRTIFQDFPERKFVLVGDSGQRDPEVYGAIARRFPQQVAGIFIHNVTKESRGSKRLTRAFRGLPPKLWQLFSHPEELDAADLDALQGVPPALSGPPA